MSKRNRTRRNGGWFGSNWFQSAEYNQRVYYKNLSTICQLATNRFRWVGLPDSVSVRYLEQTLLANGVATIAHPKGLPDAWYSLQVADPSNYNAYGEPTNWVGMGVTNDTHFDVNAENGVLVFNSQNAASYNMSPNFTSIWNAIEILARRLTHYERTEDVNLLMQQTSWFITCPPEKKNDAENLFKNVSGYEPAVIASDMFRDQVNIDVIKTDVPLIAEQLNTAKQNVWNEVYRLLGIEHLAFEKGERMIEDEANANSAPTVVMLMDALNARRQAARELSKLLGTEIEVVFNDDFESYNFNYSNNIEAQAQDGAANGGANDANELA